MDIRKASSRSFTLWSWCCWEDLQERNSIRRQSSCCNARVQSLSRKLFMEKLQRKVILCSSDVNHLHAQREVSRAHWSLEGLRYKRRTISIFLQQRPRKMLRENRQREGNSSYHSRANSLVGVPQQLLQKHGSGNLSRSSKEIGFIVNVELFAAKATRAGTQRHSRVEEILEKAHETR